MNNAMMSQILNGILFTLLAVSSIDGYSQANFNAAELTAACTNMVPSHGSSPQVSPAPYTLTGVTATYTPGTTISLTLSANSGESIKGFMIQARRVQDASTVGSFTAGVDSKLNCDNTALSHTSLASKSSVIFSWTAPNPSVGDIRFVYTVVKSFSTYWTIIPSAVVITAETTIPGASTPAGASTSTAPTTTTITTTTTTPTTTTTRVTDTTGVLADVDRTLCGIEYSCYRFPEDCLDCDFIITWMRKADNPDRVYYQMEGKVKGQETYIAIGFSIDQTMGDDSVTECAYSAINRAWTGVFMSYNAFYGYSNDRLNDDQLGLVSADSKVSYKDGKLICHFTRLVTVGADVTSGGAVASALVSAEASQVANLSNEYTLLFAVGDLNNGQKAKHSERQIAPSKVITTSEKPVNIGGSTGSVLIKVHAVLMIIAWMFAASIAVTMPRHHRETWSRMSCGKAIWFQVHQPLMIITALLTAAGFIIIFINAEGYAYSENYPDKVHPPFGIIITGFVFINIIMGACRPGPDSSRRLFFNIFHWLVGMSAYLGAIVCIFIGVYMAKTVAPEGAKWPIVAFILLQFVIEILLLIVNAAEKSKKVSVDKYEMQPTDSGDVARVYDETPNYRYRNLRKFLLTLHVVGLITCCVALIVLIVRVGL